MAKAKCNCLACTLLGAIDEMIAEEREAENAKMKPFTEAVESSIKELAAKHDVKVIGVTIDVLLSPTARQEQTTAPL
jgi:fatty acid-binding protein DegV